jgi:Uma2 family endonuclease
MVFEFTPDELRPIRRVEYEQMAQMGIFDDERVELLYGTVVRMSPTGPRHDSVIQVLTRLLVRALDPRAAVRIQSSFAASDQSEPQPDVAVVPPGAYADAHPREAWLIVEVTESSRKTDRGRKASLYAESSVPEYWVVDLVSDRIEVYTEVAAGEYTRIVPYRKGERVSLLRFPDVSIAVDEILPQ